MTAPQDDVAAPGFWREKTLEEMNTAEWEALCDGCGKCCLVTLLDEVSGEVSYTNVTCRLFDEETCRCSAYAERFERVPQCVKMTPETARREKDWLPKTCAYRLLAEGKDIPPWHPLITGDPQSVHAAKASVQRLELFSEEVVPEDFLGFHLIEAP